MKKIIFVCLIVFVSTVCLYNVSSAIFFEQFRFEKVIPVSNGVTNIKEDMGRKSLGEKYVRIVILANNYQSKYHSTIYLKGDGMSVSFGNKFSKLDQADNLELNRNSKYFKDGNRIRISNYKSIKLSDDGVVYKKYKGEFEIYKESSGLILVNKVLMDDYVAGVVSSEIGNGSPYEALKAQAVCARTFICDSKPKLYEKYKASGDDSTSYQVYNRIEPNKACFKAANTTSGEIMTYKGKKIKAFYFSTSCGYTTDDKIWGKTKQNYLEGVSTVSASINTESENDFARFIKSKPKSIESKCQFYRWKVTLTNEQLNASIKKTTGIDVGTINYFQVDKRGKGGIVSELSIYGSKHRLEIENQNQIRNALCSSFAYFTLNDKTRRNNLTMLPSAFIYIEKQPDASFTIYGGGFGHGSGMSQNGAIEMAKKGKKYETILKKYYSHIKITSITS